MFKSVVFSMLVGSRAASIALFAMVLVIAASATPARALDVDVSEYTLDNGMKVIVIPDHRAPVVTHMVWVRVGSADEELGKSGIAHYLEHLLFKGTKRLKPGEFSKIIRLNGGEDNAFTSYDFTAYFERIATDRLELVMDLGADRFANTTFNDRDVKTELEVVKEERRSRTENNPAALLREQLNAASYTAHTYGRPVIGWMSEVETLTADDAESFYRKYYTPSNAALVVVGDVDPEKVHELAMKYYGKLKNTAPTPERARTQEPTPIAAKRVEMSDPRTASPSIARKYLVPGVNQAPPGVSEALDLLGQVLGGGSSSYLYTELVTRQNIASQVSSWHNGDTLDGGELSISIAPAPGVDVKVAEEALDAALHKLFKDGVPKERVERARKQLIASNVYAIDSQFRLAYIFGAAFAIGRSVEHTKQWSNRIKQVTAEQVTEAARTYLKLKNSATGVLVPAPRKAASASSN
ncbi:MAG: pitrilysin family protein [Pseudomonadota bacterium]